MVGLYLIAAADNFSIRWDEDPILNEQLRNTVGVMFIEGGRKIGRQLFDGSLGAFLRPCLAHE